MRFFLILVALGATATAAGSVGLGQTLIEWNVSATAKGRKGGKGGALQIMDQVVGRARKGKVHAILGPSGSGKTSLLLALSQTVPRASLELTGSVTVAEGADLDVLFVPQEDLMFAQLTAYETLLTSAELKDPLGSRLDREALVESTLLSLGLKKARDTAVGDAKTRGLSGGEKKRLAIAQQILLSTRADQREVVVFADECTSGLDAYQAQNVVGLLRSLADDGNTVVTTIHQPRASVFALFDDVTLLSEGRVLYSGPREGMPTHFAKQGYACPSSSTPAEFFLDLVSIDYSSPQTEAESRARVAALAKAFHLAPSSSSSSSSPSGSGSERALVPVRLRSHSLLRRLRTSLAQFKTLFVRSLRQVVRDKPLNIARLASSLFSALLFGAIYNKLGAGAGSVPDRLGLLQVAAVNTAMVSLIKSTTSFVQEKLIVNRERRAGSYTVVPYFVAKLLAEAPLSAFFPCLAGSIIYKFCGLNPAPGRFLRFLGILVAESFASSALGMLVGSFANSVDSAVAVAPSVMVIFIVFGGLYIKNVPAWAAFLPKISLIKHAFEALCVNEFTGLELVPEARFGPLAVTKGEQVLDQMMGYGASTVRAALLAQGVVIAFNYVATCLSLALQKPAFAQIKPAEEGEGEGGEKEGEAAAVVASAALEDDEPRLGTTRSAAAAPKMVPPRVGF